MLHPIRSRLLPIFACVAFGLICLPGRSGAAGETPPSEPVGGDALAFVDKSVEVDLFERSRSLQKWRASPRKGHLVVVYGGNADSEQAVVRGLAWIAAHQLPDGGWSFDHTKAPDCQGKCSHPGNLETDRNAATAMALLPFLGSGQSHRTGKFKSNVKQGLQFLLAQMKPVPTGGSFLDGGTMYSHGLASIALCEAYGMSLDKGLKKPAQDAIDFIVSAQDPVGGGWRYQPRQPGDTSVFGWQRAALYAAEMSSLEVPELALKRAATFLDGVQNPGGTYGYIQPGNGQATTAIGLLGRIHQGWSTDNATLRQGVRQLVDWGPSPTNLYYDFYAAQVLRHSGDEAWKDWNAKNRDALIAGQEKEGHAKGSWFGTPRDAGAVRGGRLYCTSMAILMLEVYYRYPPAYSIPPDRPKHDTPLEMKAD